MKNENAFGLFGLVESQIDLLFESVCEEFSLESGDVTPELQKKLDKCLEELEAIVEEFINLNK